MKNFRYLQHTQLQRITARNTLTRIGDLDRTNLSALLQGIISDESVVIRNGNFINISGWGFDLEAGGFYIQKISATEVLGVTQEDAIPFAITPADSVQDRYDLIQGRYDVVEETPVTVDIIDKDTGAVSTDSVNIDKVIKLVAEVKEGTLGSGIAPSPDGAESAKITGTPDLSTPIDLSINYNIKIDVNKTGSPVIIDCRGADPANTTLAEIKTAINGAGFGVIATDDGSGHLVVTSPTTGVDSFLNFTPPTSAPSGGDCLTEILGLVEDPLYDYEYNGDAGFFKLGEVYVPAGSGSLSPSNVWDVDERGSWTADSSTIKRIFDLHTIQTDLASKSVKLVGEALEGSLVVKDLVYWNTSNSRWEKASFINLPTGIITDLATQEVTLFGQKTSLSGLTIGFVYMSSTGNLTSTKTPIKIGFAKSATELLVDIDIVINESNILISTQAEFERYFGDGTETGTGQTVGGWDYSESSGLVTVTVPKNTFVFLKSNPSDGVISHFKYDATSFPIKAYELKTMINLQTSVRIEGSGIDQTIIVRGITIRQFITDYAEQEAVTGVSSNDFTVPDSSEFKSGQTINHSQDDNFYQVIDVPDGTSILVNKPITGTATGNLSVCQDSIQCKNFTFDGRGGIDGLGGSLNGRAFWLQYCAHSNFEAKVINCNEQAAAGGAYLGGNTYKLNIKNIFHCKHYSLSGTAGGGACSQIENSIINEIYNCEAQSDGSHALGGACFQCNNSMIFNVYNCEANSSLTGDAQGGACWDCDNSRIFNIFECKVTAESTGNAQGGGVYGGDNSDINNIFRCKCESVNGLASGGGVYLSLNSKIKNIHNCTCEATGTGNAVGGGIAFCDECSEKSEIHNCSVTADSGNAQGGGIANCDNGVTHGIYDCSASNTGNTAVGGGAYGCLFEKIHSFNNCSADIGGIADSCTECDIGNANNSSPNGVTGAGINNCDQSTLNGNFNNSNDTGPPPRLVRNSVNCAWNIVHDGTAKQASGTPGF
jgi:hypothetical protein